MNRKKYYPKSYKEKKNPTPHESGRKWLSTTNKDSLSKNRNEYNTDDETVEFTHKSEVEWIFGESSHDAEQDIYDTIDAKLWSKDISPDLMEALSFYEEHEEPSSAEKLHQLAKNHKSKSTNQYEDYDEEFYEKRKKTKLSKKELKNQEIEIKYNDVENEFNLEDDHKIKLNSTNKLSSWYDKYNSKNKKNYKRYQHVDTEPTNRVKKGVKKKNRNNTQKDIEKYGFAT